MSVIQLATVLIEWLYIHLYYILVSVVYDCMLVLFPLETFFDVFYVSDAERAELN